MISQERLKSILKYEPDTGKWIWLVNMGRNKTKGKLAGYTNDQGYKIISIGRVDYRSSRLAWLYVTGKFPVMEIDHIDRNPSNDKWNNLREATRFQNNHNRGTNSNNTSGYKGIDWRPERNKWRSRIRYNGKDISLGHYDVLEDAINARLTAEEKYFGEFR